MGRSRDSMDDNYLLVTILVVHINLFDPTTIPYLVLG
jgi:hypothetical protein